MGAESSPAMRAERAGHGAGQLGEQDLAAGQLGEPGHVAGVDRGGRGGRRPAR